MSALSLATVTYVTPATHVVTNMGPEVQSVTFAYNGAHHTINRRGKRNIRIHEGKQGVTVTNGTDKMEHMNRAGFNLLTAISIAGVTYDRREF
jgi:hypothetical protein